MKTHNIQKSFYMIGESKNRCFGCKYCRLLDRSTKNLNIKTIPSDINPLFKKLPVAVNLFYRDPLLQIKNTDRILRDLEDAHHEGPVIIITKGDFRLFPKNDYKLNLHIAFSTLGCEDYESKYEMARLWPLFISNLYASKEYQQYKYSIEWRPIIYNFNDNYRVINEIMNLAKRHKMPVGYSALQGKPDVVKYWEKKDIDLKPFPGYEFGHKKLLSEEVECMIQEASKKYHVPIFRKTSCLMSYIHGLERDYNAHYYRPSEVGCKGCVMEEKCQKFYNNLDGTLDIELPFKHEIVWKDNHECILSKQNICEYPTPDCRRIKGWLIKINERISTADVRVIKWLTGMTVDADFYESDQLSNRWLKNE